MTGREYQALADFVAKLEIDQQRERERAAAGWVVVCTDDESGKLVNAVGPYPTAEAAFIASAAHAAEDERLKDPGDAGWTHTVLPLFAADDEDEL